MKITILTDNPNSWIIPYIEVLKSHLGGHDVTHIYKAKEIVGGEVMFMLSCEKILPSKYLAFHKHNIVVHPSRVPHGKGWSPLAYQVLEGCNEIPVSLFEAVEQVDAGDVYIVDTIRLTGYELNDEIKAKQGEITIKMILEYLDRYDTIVGIPQSGEETFYQKRKDSDNELDVNRSIKEQFNLLRIVDNERYPAHFFLDGHRYTVKVYKDKTEENGE